MTTIITPMGLPWPAEWADPYIDEITLTQGSIDAIREDADLMLVGGGDLTLVADLFSWSAPIYLYSTRTGYYATIASGSLTVLDGHSIYFNPVSRPMPTAAVSLLSAASIPPASIMMGVRRGSTVVIRNRGIAVVNLTLDDAYNNDGGAATIDVDAGDVSWDVTGAYSFIIDLTAATGDVDGFIVQNVVPPNGVSSSFRVTKNTTNDVVDLWARVGDAHIEASTGLVLQSNGTTDITFNARSNTKTLSDVSNATFTGSISAETSIYGALNSLAASGGSSVYGSEHVANESEGVSSTSSTTWQTKLTLTTPSLPSGEYIVEYQFEFYDDEGEFGDVQVLHEAAVIAFSQFTGRDAFDEDYSLHSGFFILDSISGVQNFYIQYRGDGTLDNLFIRRARLRLYRLS